MYFRSTTRGSECLALAVQHRISLLKTGTMLVFSSPYWLARFKPPSAYLLKVQCIFQAHHQRIRVTYEMTSLAECYHVVREGLRCPSQEVKDCFDMRNAHWYGGYQAFNQVGRCCCCCSCWLLNIPATFLLGCWHYWVGARTGWHSVSTLYWVSW